MQEETHGIDTKDTINQDQIQTQDKNYLGLKAGILTKLDYDPYMRVQVPLYSVPYKA